MVQVKPRVNKANTAVETQGVKHSMNPFDELSIEEAVRMRERKNPVEDILAFSAGPTKSQDILRTAMAMGADRGIHVVEEKQEIEPLAVAKLLQKVVEEENRNFCVLWTTAGYLAELGAGFAVVSCLALVFGVSTRARRRRIWEAVAVLVAMHGKHRLCVSCGGLCFTL